MSSKLASILQPSKFLLLVLQIDAITVILKSRNQHIYVGLSPSLDQTSDQFKSATNQISFWCIVALACLVVEFMIVFGGRTLFNDK